MRMMKSAKKWRRKHATNGMCTVGGGGASVLIKRCMEPSYSRSRKIAADDEDAARRTRQRGQDIPASGRDL
jgi:hypothetical protein